MRELHETAFGHPLPTAATPADAYSQASCHTNRVMTDYEEDPPALELPPPDRVVRRAFVLAAVCCRGVIEDSAASTEIEVFRREVVAWLRDVGAIGEVEPWEMALLSAPLGTLNELQRIDASWCAEGLGLLAWALYRYELPSYQQATTPPCAADAVGLMTSNAAELIESAVLREPTELELLAERLLALHWRLRQFSMRPERIDFVSFASTAYFGPLNVGGLEFAGGDLAIDGRPLMDVAEARWRECLSIAQERQRAANWLCGQEALYVDVTCAT